MPGRRRLGSRSRPSRRHTPTCASYWGPTAPTTWPSCGTRFWPAACDGALRPEDVAGPGGRPAQDHTRQRGAFSGLQRRGASRPGETAHRSNRGPDGVRAAHNGHRLAANGVRRHGVVRRQLHGAGSGSGVPAGQGLGYGRPLSAGPGEPESGPADAGESGAGPAAPDAGDPEPGFPVRIMDGGRCFPCASYPSDHSAPMTGRRAPGRIQCGCRGRTGGSRPVPICFGRGCSRPWPAGLGHAASGNSTGRTTTPHQSSVSPHPERSRAEFKRGPVGRAPRRGPKHIQNLVVD